MQSVLHWSFELENLLASSSRLISISSELRATILERDESSLRLLVPTKNLLERRSELLTTSRGVIRRFREEVLLCGSKEIPSGVPEQKSVSEKVQSGSAVLLAGARAAH